MAVYTCQCVLCEYVCVCVYDPDPVLAVFCTELMMELLYTKYICKGLDLE